MGTETHAESGGDIKCRNTDAASGSAGENPAFPAKVMNIPPKWLPAEEMVALEQFVKRYGDITIKRRRILDCLKYIEWWTVSNGTFRLEGLSLTGVLEKMEQLITTCEPKK